MASLRGEHTVPLCHGICSMWPDVNGHQVSFYVRSTGTVARTLCSLTWNISGGAGSGLAEQVRIWLKPYAHTAERAQLFTEYNPSQVALHNSLKAMK
jgi:hypothetical protein